jgi:hypothetical protein
VIVCCELVDEFSDLYRRYGGAMSLSLDAKVSAATPGRATIAPLARSTSIGVKARSRKALRTGRAVR